MAINYWKIPNEDLIKLCVLFGIEHDPENFNRKDIIPLIIEKHAEAGQLTGAVAHDDEGNEVDLKKEKDTFNIIFYNQDGQPKYVYLGHNGHSLYLPREVNLCLPKKFLGVIRDAVQIKVVPKQLPDGRTKGTTEMRVPRFSYQILPD